MRKVAIYCKVDVSLWKPSKSRKIQIERSFLYRFSINNNIICHEQTLTWFILAAPVDDDLSEPVRVEQRTPGYVHWRIVSVREGQQQRLKVNIESTWINTIWIIGLTLNNNYFLLVQEEYYWTTCFIKESFKGHLKVI